MRAAFPGRVGRRFFLPCGGRGEEGKQAVVPPAALPPSFLQSLTNTVWNAWLCILCVHVVLAGLTWRALGLGTTPGVER